ncbi:MAG: type II toxin-antitoxin system RelE/ParE family toxin [Paracraurococcus sp.]
MTPVPLSPEARDQIARLRRHYLDRDRPEAAEKLRGAIVEATARIRTAPCRGLPAPRPYPQLARPGRYWIKVGVYWVAYRAEPPAINAIFHEAADIPNRLR